MATNGPPSRRRTELRRRPPDYPPDNNQPQFPEDYSDSEGSDIDLDYLASGGRQAKTPRVRQIATQDNWILKSPYTRYLLGGMFILGIAAGIALDSVINLEPNNVASREVIDRQTPNPDICLANGMSALVLDQRLFVSFNPFNVYVSQAEVKPGCVLRQSNWQVLESRGLVTRGEVQDCKKNMNTFGFVGDLRKSPEVNCIYHSETAENQFLKDPSKAALGDGFQPKEPVDP
ncbi:hypothetical protein KFL_002600140 [Klebsormidium nitens]|uniref:DUF3172 domain-containing protein n=1 Tax=Klebsormidium nitens TaxID=105231 RepID=A0A1Y1IB30_KLENI|nr:hypothetical protein KFL_002600140 [Klebsormidium nitens]|eukprot:GAQ85906.1 hypothetical protein KFL_002600140 [Klebsormidium nitens]